MMHKLKEMLYAELEEYAERGELSASALETLHKITDTIKNIDKIEMLEDEGGYSQDGEGYERGGSYARGGRGGRHYVRGHYSRDGGSYDGRSYARESYNRGGYSRHDGKHHMMDRMEELMQSAGNDREREAIRRCMDQLEKIE